MKRDSTLDLEFTTMRTLLASVAIATLALSGLPASQAQAQQSLNGAKLLLKTAANRVRQVVDEIEIVTQADNQ